MVRHVVTALLVLALTSSAAAQGEDLETARRVEELIASLADPDEGVRWEAVLLLGEVGPPAASAAPSLVRALEDPWKQIALFALTAVVPVGVVCGAIAYAVTRDWAQPYLPDAVLSVLPFPAAATLSGGFFCALGAVWACWRKPA